MEFLPLDLPFHEVYINIFITISNIDYTEITELQLKFRCFKKAINFDNISKNHLKFIQYKHGDFVAFPEETEL